MKYLLVLIIMLQANSCQQKNIPNSTEMKNLEETSSNTAQTQIHDIWALSAMDMEKINLDNYPEGCPTIEIFLHDKTVSGFSGCNQYIASLEIIAARDIKFGNIMATKKYCATVNEKLYFDYLAKVNAYQIEKMELILFEDGKEILRFKKVD